MQRSYNMLKIVAKSEDVTLLSLATYSKITAYYGDYAQGVDTVQAALSELCDEVILVPHGGNYNRKANKSINGFKSLFSSDAYDVVSLRNQNMLEQVDALIKNGSFDLVHLDTLGLHQYVEKTNIPIILNHHNIESQMMQRRAENAKPPLSYFLKSQAKKLRKLEDKVCKNIALNVTCSEFDAKILDGREATKTTSIPNGVDLKYFSRTSSYVSKDTANLIFVGGLEWYPNKAAMLFFADHIWPTLREEVDHATMTVVGRGRVNALNRLADDDERFRVTGFVDDILPLMESADIYVCPIVDGGGTKLKVLDALAMGIPIVAHPIACEGIDVIDGKHVIFAESAKDFTAKIVLLNRNEALREELSVNGRKLIEEKYSYEVVGKKLLKTYSSCDSQ